VQAEAAPAGGVDPISHRKPSGGYDESGVSRSTIGKGSNEGGACLNRDAR
jgi:hypothetical protein